MNSVVASAALVVTDFATISRSITQTDSTWYAVLDIPGSRKVHIMTYRRGYKLIVLPQEHLNYPVICQFWVDEI